MEVVGVKFNHNNKIYYFLPNGINLKENDIVVVDTINGRELAYVKKSLFNLEEEFSEPIKNIVRLATAEDLKSKEKFDEKRPEVLAVARELISKLKLEMKIVDVEFTLDGGKIIITYVCEDRVDFRDLVKELAGKLKSRIELKQIGIRDQAKIVGGIGSCGQVCCCKRYLNEFDKVSIKMAKNQNLSLNPTKISGVCGRLMCCLSYENNNYAESISLMPKISSNVKTPDGEGIVIFNDLLNKKCTVRLLGDDVKVNVYELENLKFNKFSESNQKPCEKKCCENKNNDAEQVNKNRSNEQNQNKNANNNQNNKNNFNNNNKKDNRDNKGKNNN